MVEHLYPSPKCYRPNTQVLQSNVIKECIIDVSQQEKKQLKRAKMYFCHQYNYKYNSICHYQFYLVSYRSSTVLINYWKQFFLCSLNGFLWFPYQSNSVHFSHYSPSTSDSNFIFFLRVTSVFFSSFKLISAHYFFPSILLYELLNIISLKPCSCFSNCRDFDVSKICYL